jgi:predicted nucleotidyltransferase
MKQLGKHSRQPEEQSKMAEDLIREPGAEWLVIPSAIRALVQRIAERFQPEKIILFGSYAYGHPKPESDVDLLVVMDTPLRARQQRLEISRAVSPRPFPLDIVVRTPQELAERIALGDLFLGEITTRGKVLYTRPKLGLL